MDTQRLYLKVCEQCGCQFESHFAVTRYCYPRCANLSKKHKLRDERLQNLGDDVRERERLALLDKNFLTIADAARLLQMSRNTLYKIIKENDIPLKRFSLRSVRIARKDLEKVAAKRATVRIAPELRVRFAEPTGDGYEYTGLVTRPCAIHGGEDGQLYLEWGANMDKDFDHYELYRSTEATFACTPETFVCKVMNEVYDGIPYRIARHEDTGLDSHRRYYYRIRPVYKNGTKGPLSEVFSAVTMQVIP